MSAFENHVQLPVKRACALRFPVSTDCDQLLPTLEIWNERFKESFGGVGYFNFEPETEVGEHGAEHAFYLYADSAFWKDVTESRTFTLDEPVAVEVAA